MGGRLRNTGKYCNIIQAIEYKAIKDYNVAESDGWLLFHRNPINRNWTIIIRVFRAVVGRPILLRSRIKIQRESLLFLFLLLRRQQINQAPVFYRDLLLF